MVLMPRLRRTATMAPCGSLPGGSAPSPVGEQALVFHPALVSASRDLLNPILITGPSPKFTHSLLGVLYRKLVEHVN